jgi:hypothetical protein
MRKYGMWIVAATILLGGGVCRPASAFFLYGQQFLTACESDDQLQLGVCLGYIQGVADTLEAQRVACLPRIGARELRVVVVKSLQDKPDDLNRPAIPLVARILRDTYRCST